MTHNSIECDCVTDEDTDLLEWLQYKDVDTELQVSEVRLFRSNNLFNNSTAVENDIQSHRHRHNPYK